MQHLDEGTLQTWLDRERAGLDPSELAEIESHLAACSECSDRLDQLAGLDERAHALLTVGGEPDATPSFDAVVARSQGTKQRRRAITRLRSFAWAASIVLAVGIGWMTNDLYRGDSRLEPSRVPAEEMERAQEPLEFDAQQAPLSRQRAAATSAPAEEQRAEPALSSEPAPRTLVADAGRGADVAATGAAAPPPDALGVSSGIVADADDRAGVSAERVAAPADVVPEPAAAPRLAETAARRRPDSADAPDAFADAAAGTVVLRGRIEDDSTGEPVPSAQVLVEDLDIGMLSRQDGTFLLTVPATAENELSSYELTVSRIGYRTQQKEVAARPGESLVTDFTLAEEALQLDEVVVTGTVDVAQRRALGNTVESSQPVIVPDDWRPTSLAAAETAVGSVVLVPGLEIVTIETGRLDSGTTVVRVRQRLEDGTVLRLVEGVADPAVEAWVVDSAGAVASRRVGDLLVTGTSSVPPEELRRLLETLR